MIFIEYDKNTSNETYKCFGDNHLSGNYDHSHIDKDLNVNHDANGLDNDNDDHLSLRRRSALVSWSEEKMRRLGKPSSAWSSTLF